jgi:DNA primase
MTIDTLLSRLDGVKSAGPDRWYARCPAHDDKSPSLSIRDTGSRTLIHCFAGCEAEDVLIAIGLTWRDLYRDEWQAAREAAIHQRIKLPPIDRIALEHRVIDLAEADLRAGKTLSVEDRVRLEIALQRVKESA